MIIGKRKRTHRELMTEPGYPKRQMKRLGGETKSEFHMYIAYQWGYGAAGGLQNRMIPRRFRTNPYKPGTHRHAEYERGMEACREDDKRYTVFRR